MRIWLVIQDWVGGYNRDSFDSFVVLSAHASEEDAVAARDAYRGDVCGTEEEEDADGMVPAHDFVDDDAHWCSRCESGWTVTSVELQDASPREEKGPTGRTPTDEARYRESLDEISRAQYDAAIAALKAPR